MATIAVSATCHIEGQGKTALKIAIPTPVKASFTYELGTDLASAVATHGEAVVFSYFHKGAVVAVQNVARLQLERGASVEAIQNSLNVYRLGVTAPRAAKTVTEQDALGMFASMTPDAQAAFIKSLRERAAAAKQA
jgi:hypothetical protein